MFRYFKDLEKLADALHVEYFATMDDELQYVNSQDPAVEVLALMKANDFNIVPVKEDGEKSFFVDREKDLKYPSEGEIIANYMKPIDPSKFVGKDASIRDVLKELGERGWFFVGTGNDLQGIVTLEDLGRPAVSFYLLAKLLMIESGLRRLLGTYTNNPTTDSPSKDGVDGDPKYFKDVIKRIKKHSEEAKLTNKPDLRADLERLKVTVGDLSSMAALRDEIAHGRNILSFAKDASDVVKRNEKIDKVLAAISRLDDNREQMWKAYEDTFVKHTLSEDFWVGSNIVDLPPYLLSSSAIYIISAENPSGEVLLKNKNEDRTNAMRNVLNNRRSKNNDGKWRYEEVIGQSPDGNWKQDSFAIGGISKKEALELAKMFGQRAVFEITQEYIRVIPTDPEDEYAVKDLPRKR